MKKRITSAETELDSSHSEISYRRVFESAKIGILILDVASGCVLDVNPYLLKMLGYSHDEFCVKRLWEIPAFKNIVADESSFRKLLRHGHLHIEEVQLESRRGTMHDVEFECSTYTSRGRQLSQCNIRDISARKKSAAQMRDSTVLLEEIINAIPVRVFWKDRDSNYLGCNAAFANDAGFSNPLDMVGKNDQFMGWSNQSQNYRADDLEVMESGCSKLLFEESQTTPGGDTINLLTCKVPLRGANGDIVGVIGTYMDITARKQMQESHDRLATAVAQSAESVVITDIEGNIQYVNPAFEKVTGYSYDEVIGKNPRILKSGTQDEAFYKAMWATLAAGKTWTGHLINKRKDGALYEEDVSISPVRDACGTVIFYVAVKRDVTRVVQLEEQLRQAQKMEALGQMASGLAHDFNNALSPILGYCELLLRNSAKMADLATVQKYVEIIHTCGQDAASVVRRLREFGFQRSSNDMDSAIDLVKLVKQTIVLTQPRWKDQALANGQTIKIETDLNPVPLLLGKESSLREMLMNLIFNAVDAMPNGGTIRFLTTIQNDNILLQISDNGVGMSDDVRRRCLEPFFSTKGLGGSGLGLSMAYGIIQRLRGTILINSEVGVGTTFRIILPVLVADKESHAPAVAGHAMESLHILIVDDDPSLRELLSLFLLEDGHTSVSAANGLEGLAALREGRFDAVLTDKAMPIMNGEQFALAIHEMAPSQPVIMLTGFGDLMNAAGTLPKGVSTVLSKPFTQKQLRDALAAVLERA